MFWTSANACSVHLNTHHAQPPFVFYNPDGELTGLTIEIAKLLETELVCQFDFIIGNPERPDVSTFIPLLEWRKAPVRAAQLHQTKCIN